jgi:hypothetical protein
VSLDVRLDPESLKLTHGSGSSRQGRRLRRAERSAAGARGHRPGKWQLIIGRSAFVTTPAMPALPKKAGRIGVAIGLESLALAPPEDGGPGRKKCLRGGALTPQGQGDYSASASLRARLLVTRDAAWSTARHSETTALQLRCAPGSSPRAL